MLPFFFSFLPTSQPEHKPNPTPYSLCCLTCSEHTLVQVAVAIVVVVSFVGPFSLLLLIYRIVVFASLPVFMLSVNFSPGKYEAYLIATSYTHH